MVLNPACDHIAEVASNLVHKMKTVVDISDVTTIAVMHGEELCEVTGGTTIVQNVITRSSQVHAALVIS